MTETENQAVENRPADSCVMVIFGATGDLTRRKLLPALYNLAQQKFLPEDFAILGVGRKVMTDEEFQSKVAADLREYVGGDVNEEKIRWFAERSYYLTGAYNDATTFEKLEKSLAEIDARHKTGGNFFFYLATPPPLFAPVTMQIEQAGLSRETKESWRRFIYEKPFGRDLESAKTLNADLLEIINESQIYRIDHYLGKETVQNILVFRFANGIYEPIWNRTHIDSVQIKVAEKLGVEERCGYYDRAGALRDTIPNHIFQLITLTAMEPPVSFNDYIKENGVAPGSKTDTFAALKIEIDNWRWAGVPFYIRTGKSSAMRHSEIVIQFKRPPFVLFRHTEVERMTANRIRHSYSTRRRHHAGNCGENARSGYQYFTRRDEF